MSNPQDLMHPYEAAVTIGDFTFVSGCLPVDEQENLVTTPEPAFEAALEKLRGRLAAVDLDLSNVVKLTYFSVSVAYRDLANLQYEKTWSVPRPARTFIGVAELPRGALLEIDCIASVRQRSTI